VLLAQHTAKAVLAVGLRSESTAAALSDRNDGSAKFFSSPQISVIISGHQWLKT
jgi:hypothetical protein